MSRFKDLSGMQFGRLTVVAFAGMKDSWAQWETRCSCGNLKTVPSARLIQGQTKSCGCLSRETTAARNRKTLKHGLSYSPEYATWHGMIARCENPKGSKFHLYGGRGIQVCGRWRESFSAFYADMGPRPSSKHSIDRFPDKNGNYEPSNCRWATWSEQNSNRNTYTRRQKIIRTETSHGRA